MKQSLIMLLLVIVLSSICYAEPSLFFKRGEIIDLKIPCVNNETACSNSATCNLTINYPNTSVMINNKLMTNKGVYHNYTLGTINILGEYQLTILCIDGVDNGYSIFSFEVTDNGQKGNDYTFILAIGIICFLLVLIGIAVDSKEHFALKLTCFLFALIFAILIPASFTTFDVKNIFYGVFIGFVVVFGVYLGIIGIYRFMIKMGVIRGKSENE